MANEKDIIELLQGIKNDTGKINVIEEKLKRLEKLEDEFESKTIHTVKNNNSLADYFKSLSRTETKIYMKEDDNRKSLIALIKEIFVSELNMRLVKILGWQATILTALFIAYLKLWVQ